VKEIETNKLLYLLYWYI